MYGRSVVLPRNVESYSRSVAKYFRSAFLKDLHQYTMVTQDNGFWSSYCWKITYLIWWVEASVSILKIQSNGGSSSTGENLNASVSGRLTAHLGIYLGPQSMSASFFEHLMAEVGHLGELAGESSAHISRPEKGSQCFDVLGKIASRIPHEASSVIASFPDRMVWPN